MKKWLLTGLALAIAVPLLATDGPLTNLMNLRVRTNESGYLIVSGGAVGAVDGPLTAMANLRGRTDENGYLRVTLASGSTITSPVLAGGATIGGHLLFSPDNTYDIGASGATRPANGYFGAFVFAGSGFETGAAGAFGWAGRTYVRAPADGKLTLLNNGENAGVGIDVSTDAIFKVRTRAHTGYAAVEASDVAAVGANGQSLAIKQLTELTTIAAAATTDTTIQMPAGAIVLAVSTRVTTVIPTAATFTVGDSGSAARFNTAAVSSAATSTDAGTKAGAYYNASALAIRITPNATPADNTGRVRVTIYYLLGTPPTS